MKRKIFKFFLSILTGIILYFSFPPFSHWYFAFIGFIPLFLSFDNNLFLNFIKGWVSGIVFYGLSLFWLKNVAEWWYLILALYLGFYWGIFSFLLTSLPSKGRVFAGMCIWFFIEIIIANSFSGFPWLLLGLSQWKNHIFLPISAIFGIYGISMVIILSNLTLFYGLRKGHTVSFILSCFFLFSILLYSHIYSPQMKKISSVNLLIIQENIPSDKKIEPASILNSYYLTTQKILKNKKAELVVWPESTYPDLIKEKILKKIKRLSKRYRCGIIFGSLIKENGDIFNSAIFVKGEKIEIYKKIHLVPYGEFVPGRRFRIIRKIYSEVGGNLPNLKPGNRYLIFKFKNFKISAPICFENIFPDLIRKFNMKGANLFIVITNDSWFGKSAGPYQHFAHNIFRAVETGKYFVQVSTTGISGIISPEGRIVSSVGNGKIFVRGFIQKKIPCIEGETFYSKYGNIPLFILSTVITGVILCKR